MLLNGSSEYLTLPDSDNWAFGTGDFTIDCWVRWNGFSVANYNGICGQYTSNTVWWGFCVYSGDGVTASTLYFFSQDTGLKNFLAYGSQTFNKNTWYHIAAVRSGTTITVYCNGVAVGSTVSDLAVPDIASTLTVGKHQQASNYYTDGWIDEFRISKGIARWTSGFTPPTQSYDCPLDTQTKLLIHGGGPNASTAFYDNSTTARTITTAGGTVYDNTQYKLRVSSIKFDGTGDYITAPDSTDWAFGTEAFTIDFWINCNANNKPMWVSQYPSALERRYAFAHQAGAGFTVFAGAGICQVAFTCDWTISLNTWHHIAFVRIDGGNAASSWRIFLDGVSLTLTLVAGAWSGSVSDVGGDLNIGAGNLVSDWFDGWLDELRISKGIARWTSDFTPPTAPYDSPLAQYVIDGLNGDTDKEYRLLCKLVDGSTVGDYKLTFNTDTGNNYGYQDIKAIDTVASAAQDTSEAYWHIGQTSTDGYQCFSDTIIFAKARKVRVGTSKISYDITGTTITGIIDRGHVWSNTTDNITSMVIAAAADRINVGSRLILSKKRQLTTGTKTGEIQPVGTTYGHWQKIYDTTLTAARTRMGISSRVDSYTKLLLHMDGADASVLFTDFSNSAHTVTPAVTAQVDTAQSKFGGASLLLDGNSDYLSIPDSDDWFFGTGDFTIDFWVRFNSLTTGDSQEIVSQRADANNQWFIDRADGATGAWTLTVYAGGVATIQANAVPNSQSTGVWYHMAIVRSGNDFKWYQDGTQIGATLTNTDTIANLAASLLIGCLNGTTRFLNGWLDEFRISKGIARWTSGFTPPTRAYNELDGDKDVLYKLILRSNAGALLDTLPVVQFNSDTGSNYGYQILYCSGITKNAARSVDDGVYLARGGTNLTGTCVFGTLLICAKSGSVRTILEDSMEAVSGTTVTTLNLVGYSWNNTADNITGMIVSLFSAGTRTFAVGTHLELWRLNL